MDEIKSVTVGGNELPADMYTISYSTDKTAVLNEYSGDWTYKNDVMSWTPDSENAVNFRIVFDKSIKVCQNESLKVIFTAHVLEYVTDSGISNIAWNSFAYAYQNESVSENRISVSEADKIGIWAKTSTAEN